MVKTVWWAKHSGQHKCTFKATMSTQVYFNLRAQDKAKRQKTSHEQFKSWHNDSDSGAEVEEPGGAASSSGS